MVDLDEFFDEPAQPAATPATRLRVALCLVLVVLAVPWYWQWFPQAAARLVWGIPLWVFASVAGCLAIAVVTAWQFLAASDGAPSTPADSERRP